MRLFHLQRHLDESGVSGEGRVAEGVIFSDDQVVLQWLSPYRTFGLYPAIEVVEAIHGHGGATEIVFDSPPVVHLKLDDLQPESASQLRDEVRRRLGLPAGAYLQESPYLEQETRDEPR